MLAPLLAAHARTRPAGVLYFLFSPMCHQMRERSFMIAGHPLALCHRCFGLYAGLFLASLFPIKYLSLSGTSLTRRTLVLAAGLPILFDALLPYSGLWINSSWSRCGSGFLFGAMAALLLSQGIRELFDQTAWPDGRAPISSKGDVQ